MYDYINVHSKDYSMSINKKVFESFLLSKIKFSKDSNLEYSKVIFDETIRLRGILANSFGNYAFNSYDEFKEINLIEIVIPDNLNTNLEKEILSIANLIGKEYAWQIDLRE